MFHSWIRRVSSPGFLIELGMNCDTPDVIAACGAPAPGTTGSFGALLPAAGRSGEVFFAAVIQDDPQRAPHLRHGATGPAEQRRTGLGDRALNRNPKDARIGAAIAAHRHDFVERSIVLGVATTERAGASAPRPPRAASPRGIHESTLKLWRDSSSRPVTLAGVFDVLKTGIDGLERQTLMSDGRFAGSGVRICEVPHEGNTNASPEEAAGVAGIIEELLQARWRDADNVVHAMTTDDIMVVTPFNAQILLNGHDWVKRAARNG